MIIAGDRWSNWSGSVICKPRQIVRPKDEVDLAACLRSTKDAMRAVGSGLSISPLCATDGVLLELTRFSGLTGFDPENNIATIGAATPLWEIASLLHPEGYALGNMGDNDRETLGGAVASGTHGSGWSLGSLSADVGSFNLVTTRGEVLRCAPDDNAEIFAAGRVSLGLFGAVTEIGMKVRPRYKLAKSYFIHSVDETFRQLDGMVRANRHFEFFWYPYNDHIVCKSLNETDARAPEPRSAQAMRLRGARPNLKSHAMRAIYEALPYMPGMQKSAHRVLAVLRRSFGRVRWSNETFPSPRLVRFSEMEYAVPYEDGPDAVREIAAAIRKKRIVTGYPIVFRVVDGDDIWLSPFYGRKCATISVHQYHRHDPKELFDTCEDIFRDYGGRPHWGKWHTMTATEAAKLYPKYEAFRMLRRRIDPEGKFLNRYLRGILPE
jgi:FAD-linked oxidoreductase